MNSSKLEREATVQPNPALPIKPPAVFISPKYKCPNPGTMPERPTARNELLREGNSNTGAGSCTPSCIIGCWTKELVSSATNSLPGIVSNKDSSPNSSSSESKG